MVQTPEKQKDMFLIVGRIVFTVCLVVSILFVFGNSMKAAEDSLDASERALEVVQEVVTELGSPEVADQISEAFLRKIAHVCEYIAVGFFLMLCLRVYTKRFLRHVAWPMFGGLFVALIDETIQLFSDGRSASVTDIWIDFFGIMIGVLTALFLLCLWKMFWILYKNRDKE